MLFQLYEGYLLNKNTAGYSQSLRVTSSISLSVCDPIFKTCSFHFHLLLSPRKQKTPQSCYLQMTKAPYTNAADRN